jgi:hypothetical protein
MRRIIFALVGCFLFSAVAYAHPPQDIKITFDPSTRMLTAWIVHNVSNPAGHYIKQVDIGLNGQEIITQKISGQDNNAGQTVKVLIPDVKSGDIVSVEGYCSLSGKLEKEISVS